MKILTILAILTLLAIGWMGAMVGLCDSEMKFKSVQSCSTDRPYSVVKTKSGVQCSSACMRLSRCGDFDFDESTKDCSLYRHKPLFYQPKHGCRGYKNAKSFECLKFGPDAPAIIIIPSQCCAIPFTLNGSVYYQCVDDGGGIGCFHGDRQWKLCQQPRVKEPVSLILDDNKRPDETTLLPGASGKPMAWDVTVPDTYAESHLPNSVTASGAASRRAAQNKMDKYASLNSTHILYPFAVETGGAWHEMVVELTQEIGRRIASVTEDTRETSVRGSPKGECGLLPKTPSPHALSETPLQPFAFA